MDDIIDELRDVTWSGETATAFEVGFEVEDSIESFVSQVTNYLVRNRLPIDATDFHVNVREFVETDRFSAWIKLGPDNVDFGISYPAISMDACTLDILLPDSMDSTTLINYAFGERWAVKFFGRSIFSNGETRISFGSDPTRLISSIFFFRELGFQKPHNGVVSAIASADTEWFYVHASMGPRGLLRLSVELKDPVIETLNKMARAVFADDVLLPDNYTSMEYVGTAQGFVLSSARPLVV
eukprot:GEMP01068323.1.p1 GENE.GEMP01068323.1~~GEMP01068323.1.p1  ORF type:complete len:240 (+),score=46.89 GEMP01068323.1:156-875(+)